jgi:protein SCO1/2
MKSILLLALCLVGANTLRAQTNFYSARGIIQSIAADHRQITIHHEAIPGYMMAMTMDFPVRDPGALSGLAPGQQISFTLAVTGDTDWVENLQLTGGQGTVLPPLETYGSTDTELKVGDLLPPAQFTDEHGQVIHLTDYRGRAVAFTFFFTRCPLPDYCPRMNRNFAEARKLLAADAKLAGRWQFLSVSFDAQFDSPEILGSYGALYRGTDTNGWTFAAADKTTLRTLAPRLDFHYWTENGTYSHNLRTVVLDPQGRITAQFDGNDWTPAALAEAMRRAAR